MNQRPSIWKSTALILGTGGAVLWLITMSPHVSLPAGVTPSAIIDWWSEVGTTAASMSIAWGVGLAVGIHMVIIAVVALATGLASLTGRFHRPDRLWRAVSGVGIRRLLAVSVIITLSAGPVAALDAPSTAPPIVLIDLGPTGSVVATGPPVLFQAPVDPVEVLQSEPNLWTVRPGDHLWHIAEQTLQSTTGVMPGVRDTTRYWRRLIAENFNSPSDNPDLIVPGQTIILPPV